jgi:hypothetical protein
MVFEYMTVKYKFIYLLTVKYSKTIETQVTLFGDDNWVNWMTPGFYPVITLHFFFFQEYTAANFLMRIEARLKQLTAAAVKRVDADDVEMNIANSQRLRMQNFAATPTIDAIEVRSIPATCVCKPSMHPSIHASTLPAPTDINTHTQLTHFHTI